MGSWGFISLFVVRCWLFVVHVRWNARTTNNEQRTTSSYVEEDLLDIDEVLQIEQPPQNHLDRQRHHDEEKHRADVVPRRAHLQIEPAERTGGEERRQGDIREHE